MNVEEAVKVTLLVELYVNVADKEGEGVAEKDTVVEVVEVVVAELVWDPVVEGEKLMVLKAEEVPEAVEVKEGQELADPVLDRVEVPLPLIVTENVARPVLVFETLGELLEVPIGDLDIVWVGELDPDDPIDFVLVEDVVVLPEMPCVGTTS